MPVENILNLLALIKFVLNECSVLALYADHVVLSENPSLNLNGDMLI